MATGYLVAAEGGHTLFKVLGKTGCTSLRIYNLSMQSYAMCAEFELAMLALIV